jgi:modulator of FtsH protease HflK
MAWNEPGGSGGKDPWSGRDREQGPPDLDEIIRKLQTRFSGLFGGGRGFPGNYRSVVVIAGVLLLLWLISGIYIVDPAEQGVVLRFGRLADTTLSGPHWHWPFPIEHVEIVDVGQIRNVELGYRSSQGPSQSPAAVPREALMLTQDENIVDVRLAVQYRVKSAPDYLFNVREPDTVLRKVTESALRESVGKSRLDFVLTEGRSEIAASVAQLIQEAMDHYGTGLEVTTVNMQDAQPPEEVQEAFLDAVKAREDEQRLKNEAEAYSNDILPKARGAAARRLEEASAYKAQVVAEAEGETSRFVLVLAQYQKAPQVTRERLYLDAMEAVFGTAGKVLVDVQKGGNLFMVPLDQLLPSRIGHERSPAEVTPSASPATPPAAPKADLRSADRLRSRGDRSASD